MIFMQRTFKVALTGLLLGVLLMGCGSSSDSPTPEKKAQEKTSAPVKVKEILPEGQKMSPEQKPMEGLAGKTDPEPPPEKPILRHQSRGRHR